MNKLKSPIAISMFTKIMIQDLKTWGARWSHFKYQHTLHIFRSQLRI